MLEVLKQALEALQSDLAGQIKKGPLAITSLRQAIAELESQDGVCQHCAGKGCVACDARKQEPFFKFRECEDSQAGTATPPREGA